MSRTCRGRFREAEKGRIPIGPRKPRDVTTGGASDIKILPLRLEAKVVEAMDAAWRERGIPNDYTPFERHVWSLQEARDILTRLIGDNMDWVPLDAYLVEYLDAPELRTTALASTFASSLELVRLGQVELRQSLAFGPLLVRRRKTDGAPPTEN